MLPQSYQTIFRKHLSEQQYLTLEILLLLIQVLKNQGFKPGMSKFYQGVKCGKGDESGLFRACCNKIDPRLLKEVGDLSLT